MKITPEILYDRWRKAVRDRDWVAAFALGKAIDDIAEKPDLFRKMREARQEPASELSSIPATPAKASAANALEIENRVLCGDLLPGLPVELNE